MPSSSNGRMNATNYPSLGADDSMSDELPDYSSRRSSYYNDSKPTPFDPEYDRHRKISTASNMLEVPGALYERQNSMGSTASLVSNTSNNTFSYRNLTKPKIKNAFGSFVVLFGLCLLVLGILLLIFGHTTVPIEPAHNNDNLSNNTFNYINNSLVYESNNTNAVINGINTTDNSYDNTNKVITKGYHVSAAETIGYFALFSGVLLILIGISIICLSVKEPKPSQPNPNIHFKRRVSTIEIENLPNEITKPEIMITTDNLNKDANVTYKKYATPQPTHIPRPSVSTDDQFNNHHQGQFATRYPTKEFQKKFPF